MLQQFHAFLNSFVTPRSKTLPCGRLLLKDLNPIHVRNKNLLKITKGDFRMINKFPRQTHVQQCQQKHTLVLMCQILCRSYSKFTKKALERCRSSIWIHLNYSQVIHSMNTFTKCFHEDFLENLEQNLFIQYSSWKNNA